MKRDLAKAIALGVCTFNYDQSDGDRPAKPSEPCAEICPYCEQQAEYLLRIIGNFDTENSHVGSQQQPTKVLH